MAFSPHARIGGESSTFIPSQRCCCCCFFFKWRSACAQYFYFVGHDQSTVAHVADTTVDERSLTSCVGARSLMSSYTMHVESAHSACIVHNTSLQTTQSSPHGSLADPQKARCCKSTIQGMCTLYYSYICSFTKKNQQYFVCSCLVISAFQEYKLFHEKSPDSEGATDV